MTCREAFRLNRNKSGERINIPYTPNKIQGAKACGEVVDKMPTPVKLLFISQISLEESQKVSKSNEHAPTGTKVGDTGGFPTQV
jgi:hypothetical protein